MEKNAVKVFGTTGLLLGLVIGSAVLSASASQDAEAKQDPVFSVNSVQTTN